MSTTQHPAAIRCHKCNGRGDRFINNENDQHPTPCAWCQGHGIPPVPESEVGLRACVLDQYAYYATGDASHLEDLL